MEAEDFLCDGEDVLVEAERDGWLTEESVNNVESVTLRLQYVWSAKV